MIDVIKQRLSSRLDVSKVSQPAGPRIHVPLNVDGHAKGVIVQTNGIVFLWHIGKSVGDFGDGFFVNLDGHYSLVTGSRESCVFAGLAASEGSPDNTA